MLDYRARTFLKVCENMNFTTAAKKLHLSQPAVSQHIKSLEEEYDCILFTRDKKTISLTEKGHLLFTFLKSMENDEMKLKNQLKQNEFSRPEINFGVTLTIGEYTLTSNIANYIKSNPQTNFNIFYKNTNILLNYLKSGKIDFAIVEGHFDSALYNTKIFKSEDFVAVCSKNHVFENEPESISDLLDERIIIRENGSGTLETLLRLLAIQNISIDNFSKKITVDNMHSIVEMLKKDCGISFLYKSAVQNELNSGELVEIELSDFKISHNFSFVWNINSIFSDEYLKIFSKIENNDNPHNDSPNSDSSH